MRNLQQMDAVDAAWRAFRSEPDPAEITRAEQELVAMLPEGSEWVSSASILKRMDEVIPPLSRLAIHAAQDNLLESGLMQHDGVNQALRKAAPTPEL